MSDCRTYMTRIPRAGIENPCWLVGVFSAGYRGMGLLFGGGGIRMHDCNGLKKPA